MNHTTENDATNTDDEQPALTPATPDSPIAGKVRMEVSAEDLIIDPEFKDLIPPLCESEYSLLETDVRENGVRNPILVWESNGLLIIIDGHNRHRICLNYNISFEIIKMDFVDREAAKEYIFKTQLGRRNLTTEQRDYMIGKLYESQKKRVGEHTGNQYSEIAQDELISENTAQKIAEQFKVSEATVKRAAQFSRAVDAIVKTQGEEVKAKILAGEMGAKKDIIEMGQAEQAEQKRRFSKAQKKPQKTIGDRLHEQLEKYERQLPDADLLRLRDTINCMIAKRPKDNPIDMDMFLEGDGPKFEKGKTIDELVKQGKQASEPAEKVEQEPAPPAPKEEQGDQKNLPAPRQKIRIGSYELTAKDISKLSPNAKKQIEEGCLQDEEREMS